MNTFSRFAKKLSFLFGRQRFSRELDEEMAFHREQAEKEFEAAGMTPEAARILGIIRKNDSERIGKMVEKLAGILAERGLRNQMTAKGIIEDVARQYRVKRDTVYLQERHVARAVAQLIFDQVPVGERIAKLPVLLGATWLVGWMGFAGVPFNPANIMTLPLVIGIGVTNGIHILNRFAEEQRPSILAKSTGKAVLVSALATMAGFGSLIPGKHQGMSSLGLVMAVGAFACMVAVLLFLPTLLGWLTQQGWTMPNKKPRGDNAQPPLGSGGTEAKPTGGKAS